MSRGNFRRRLKGTLAPAHNLQGASVAAGVQRHQERRPLKVAAADTAETQGMTVPFTLPFTLPPRKG